jgi:hypothetical protein
MKCFEFICFGNSDYSFRWLQVRALTMGLKLMRLALWLLFLFSEGEATQIDVDV